MGNGTVAPAILVTGATGTFGGLVAAALEVAVPCFQALVDAGEIEEWMVPFEVENADCFEGRNWYTEFDDDAYNDRVDA